jgi:tetratricopeptide (TPR) repeat protein
LTARAPSLTFARRLGGVGLRVARLVANSVANGGANSVARVVAYSVASVVTSAVASAVMWGAAACTSPVASAIPAEVRRELQPVAMPDVSSAASSVQAQLREQHGALTTLAADPRTRPDDLAAAYGTMGRLFLAAELYGAAETSLGNAQRLAPSEMRWPYFRGHVARATNDPAAAAAFFAQALTLSPDHVPSLVWLAEMHLLRGETSASEPLLTKAETLAPKAPAVAYGLGRAALAARDYARAATHLERALALAPGPSRAHYQLALAYRGLGDSARAEAHLRDRSEVELLPSDPLMGEVAGLLQNAAAYETRGVKAIDARQWPDAVAALRKAVELAPDNAFTRLNLGTALYMLDDRSGAVEQFQAAVKLNPTLAKAHYALGVAYEVDGKDADAVAAFFTAVGADAGYGEARLALANALRRSGRTGESLPHYDDILRADPGLSQASFGRAIALVRLGRYREARDGLAKGVTAFSDQPGFAHALARLLAAAPDAGVRNGARAVTMMQELFKTQPQSLPMAETMAMALAEVGRFEEAVTWQRGAVAAAEQASRADLVARLTANLRLYERRQPSRTPWADDDPIHRPAASTP